MKIGGGAQPIRADRGGFMMDHSVEMRETVGVYRAFWALRDRDEASRILGLEDAPASRAANHERTRPIANQTYLPTPLVFTTGVADAGDHDSVASGEADLACRIAHMPKALFT